MTLEKKRSYSYKNNARNSHALREIRKKAEREIRMLCVCDTHDEMIVESRVWGLWSARLENKPLRKRIIVRSAKPSCQACQDYALYHRSSAAENIWSCSLQSLSLKRPTFSCHIALFSCVYRLLPLLSYVRCSLCDKQTINSSNE